MTPEEQVFMGASAIVLLFLSGVFSGTETAFTSLSAAQLHELSQSGRAGRRVWRMCRRTSRLIVAILVGNNIANIGLTVAVTSLVLYWFGKGHTLELTLGLTFVVLVVAEITPKVLARSRPRFFARLLSLPLRLWEFAVWVPAALLEAIARGVAALAGLPRELTAAQRGESDLSSLIDMGHELGFLGVYDHEFMHRILRRGKLRLADLFTHRKQVAHASVTQSPDEIMALFEESRLSRIPIIEGDLDNPLGVLHVKDLTFQLRRTPGQADIRALLQPPVFIPSAATVGPALAQLREARQHMAFVVDEHGGVEGIVTLEDLIEQITGTITDEHDQATERFRQQSQSE